jgi:hypothetical protein
MATTFWASCSVSPGYNDDTSKYLAEEWRVSLRECTEAVEIDNIIGIVVRDYPDVMVSLENSGYFETDPPVWQINRISRDGVTLYLVNHSGKTDDGRHDLWEEVFIFIPMNNVIAIHNVSEQFFINESVSSMDPRKRRRSD